MAVETKEKKTATKKPAAKKVVKKEAATAKLRLIVSAFESKILDESVKKIMDVAEKYNATIVGPVPLPTKTKKWTVIRSSFVYKNSQEAFERRTHKRMMDIINPDAKITEALTNLSIPSGVEVEVKML
jgi:small subunit ribosomal protein S10